MQPIRVLLACVAVACVDSGVEGPKDSGTDVADAADAAIGDVVPEVGARCSKTQPFGAPVHFLAPFNSTGADVSIWLTADELTAYVSTVRNDGATDADIYVATRAKRDDVFGALSPVSGGVNTVFAEIGATLSKDGLDIYFATTRSGNFELYVATRPIATAAFGAASAVANLNTAPTTVGPFLAVNDTQLFFNAGTYPAYDLYVAQRGGSSGPFGSAVDITSLNTADDESNPVVSADGLTIYFSSDRNGSSKPLENVWTATRKDTTAAWSTPTPVDEINSDGYDVPGWISPDDCRLYFFSNRSGGLGNYDIYYADRPN